MQSSEKGPEQSQRHVGIVDLLKYLKELSLLAGQALSIASCKNQDWKILVHASLDIRNLISLL
jgi:hypothetical protein